MRPLALTVAAIAALLLLAGIFLNPFGGASLRQGLETLISERTGLAATIDSDPEWRLLWPTAVVLRDIAATERDAVGTLREQWLLDSLRLELDTTSVLTAPNDPLQWTVKAFQVDGLRGKRSSGASDGETPPATERFNIPSFWIRSLRPGSPAPFSAELNYSAGSLEPVSLTLAGRLLFLPDERRLQFTPLKLDGNVARGTCQADLALKTAAERPEPAPVAGQPATQTAGRTLLDLPRLRRTDWDANCEFEALVLNQEDFSQTTLSTSNTAGNARLELAMPTFFDGSLNLQVEIAASAQEPEPRWKLVPQVADAGSARLLTWLAAMDNDQAPPPTAWDGPINLAGQLDASGNTRQAFLQSGTGLLSLVSNSGTLDLRPFKAQASEPLAKAGSVLGEDNLLGSWPDQLAYQTLSGQWQVANGAQTFSAALDNLRLAGSGTLVPGPVAADDRLELAGKLRFAGNGTAKSLPVNALLEDIPLPFRCLGSTLNPACAVDADAARQLLTDALQGKDGASMLGEKIDTLIREKVPERYQRAARGLLEIFSQSVDDQNDRSDEEFLESEGELEF